MNHVAAVRQVTRPEWPRRPFRTSSSVMSSITPADHSPVASVDSATAARSDAAASLNILIRRRRFARVRLSAFSNDSE